MPRIKTPTKISKTGKYVCDLPRCNLPTKGANTSFDQLRDHIENSHMSRSSLYCPFRGLCLAKFLISISLLNSLLQIGCEGVGFFRGASQLEIHFRERHADLLNKVITLPSDLVLPMSLPYSPIPHDLPPPLPSHPMLGCLVVPAVRGTRIRHLEGLPLSQVSQTSVTSPRKRLRLHQQVEEETLSEESSFFFDDFEKQVDENGEFIGAMKCVLGLAAGPRFDVARPQPSLDPTQFGLKTPPTSIHYEVFSNRFDEMERTMAPRVNIPIVPISTQTSSTMH